MNAKQFALADNCPLKKVIPQQEFFDSMQRMPGAVTIVTALLGGQKVGLTATAVCSLTASPPQLLVCINRASQSHDKIVAAGAFAVNVLSEVQHEIANRFAAAPQEKRFEDGKWMELETRAPILEGAVVSFDCEISRIVPIETHSILCGLIKATQQCEEQALLYADKNYQSLRPVF